MTVAERVVLLDDNGSVIGSAPKSEVHCVDTPLHLAFSCYLHNAEGDVLVTRRSLDKLTWPGVWTNSFCGHPSPGEAIVEAIKRRAREELGCSVAEIQPALPKFRYRAVDSSGVVENEICPVFTAMIEGVPSPVPDEVAQWHWVNPSVLAEAVALTPFAFSPWLVEQLAGGALGRTAAP